MKEGQEKQARERLFLALWPDPVLQSRLAALLQDRSLGTAIRPVKRDQIHLTLLFLGNLAISQREALTAACGQITATRFPLSLDILGYWRGPAVAWIGASEVPRSLTALVDALRNVAERLGVDIDHREYIPHITLARKVRRVPPGWVSSIEPLRWEVDRFALVQSITYSQGVEYRILNQWPLQGA